MKQVFKYMLYLCLVLTILSSFSCIQTESSPTIQSIIVPKAVPPAFDVRIVFMASNTDGKPMTYQWKADNGTIRGETNAVTWFSPDLPGIHTIDVKITDVDGNTVMQQLVINVVPFTASDVTLSPVTVLKMPVPNTELITCQVRVRPLTTCEIECSISSNSKGDYKYIWTSNGGKLQAPMIKEGKAARVGWVAPGISGSYTVTVEVIDYKNNHAAGSVYFLVTTASGSDDACGVESGGGCDCGKK